MLRASRLLAAALASTTLALPAAADARIASASFEVGFRVVATCSVNVARSSQVDVDCASASTPWLLAAPQAQGPALRGAGPDAGRVTVYF